MSSQVPLLLVATAILAISVLARESLRITTTPPDSTTAAPPATPTGPPPPLPYKHYASWVMLSQTSQHGAGATKIDWVFGQHLEVNIDEKLVCVWHSSELEPIRQSNYTAIGLANYSSGFLTSHLVHDDGSASNCTSKHLSGKFPTTGGWLFGPEEDVLDQFTFLQYTNVGGNNATQWQRTLAHPDGSLTLFEWFLELGTNVPMVYVNTSTYPSKNITIVTTAAYNGYHETVNGLPAQCTQSFFCGEEVCVANPAAGNGPINNALVWACGEVDCTPVNPGGKLYYPNTVVAHATYAFNLYYQANKQNQGAGACNFGGCGQVVLCSTSCTLCNASSTATEKQLASALEWVCGKDGIQNCGPIKPGGSRYYPNTTRAHADWAFNQYYQAYKCLPDYGACDFSGTGVIVPC